MPPTFPFKVSADTETGAHSGAVRRAATRMTDGRIERLVRCL